MTSTEQQRVTDFYTWLYSTKEKHDSPEKSRVSIIRRIYSSLRAGIPQPYLLDIGSGRQSLEKQMRSGRTSDDLDLLSTIQCLSLDISEIDYSRLLARNFPNQYHLRASALAIPVKSQSLGLVVSNHAIDFIPRDEYDQPYIECKRVLATGGKAIFYFHHPSMIPDDLNRMNDSIIKQHWTYLRENDILFKSAPDIYKCLVSRVGFNKAHVSLETDSRDTWWEVEVSV